MDPVKKFKRERAFLRSSFTKAVDKFEALITDKSNVIEAEILLKQIESKVAKIEELNSKIQDGLLDDENLDEDILDEEYSKVEEYRDRFMEIQVKYEQMLKSQAPEGKIFSKKRLKLPELKLCEFDGQPKNWLKFWTQFMKLHQDDEVDDIDKYQYLLQAVTGKAKQFIERYPATAYNEAIEQLRTRYGNEDTLIELYVRELISLIVNVTKQKFSVVDLYDHIEGQLKCLNFLGVKNENFASILYPLVESCLTPELLLVWNRSKSNFVFNFRKSHLNEGDDAVTVLSSPDTITSGFDAVSKLNGLMQFLKLEAEAEERVKLAKGVRLNSEKQTKDEFKGKTWNPKPTGIDLTNTTQKKEGKSMTCIFCDKSSHSAQDCSQARKLTIEERLEVVKSKKGCLICLRPGHFSKQCKTFVSCMFCNRRHYMLFCREFIAGKEQDNKEKLMTQESTTTGKELSMLSNTFTEIILQTLCVKVKGPRGTKVCRLILDSGSQHSYICQSLVSDLNLKSVGEEELAHCLFGAETRVKRHKIFNVDLLNLRNKNMVTLRVLDESKICGFVPKVKNVELIKELFNRGIVLTDNEKSPDEINILLGADVLSQIYTGTLIKLNCGMCAIETTIGWTLMGKMTSNKNKSSTSALCLNNMTVSRALWDIETLGILDPLRAKNISLTDNEVKSYLEENIVHRYDGHYEVPMPWAESVSDLKTNFWPARERLNHTTKKLLKKNLYHEYEKTFKEWENLGIIEEVDLNKNEGHFLAHHPVIRENHESTKIRPVFDASLKGKNEISLNDCLPSGPNLIESIPGLLIKFRLKGIGVVSDLRQAFLQIFIAEHDKKYFKFLWWSDPDKQNIKCYRHNRIIFGAIISPFILNWIIGYHLENTTMFSEEVAENVKHSFYVDDFITSVESVSLLETLIKEVTGVMKSGGFSFKEWYITDPKILEKDKICKVLGVHWNRQQDQLFCSIENMNVSKPVTKRKILSVVNKIFDPLGIIAPVTLTPKLILRECWAMKLDWDDEVPANLENKIFKWLQEIKQISEIHVPRWIFKEDDSNYCLHAFCDASQDAYGASIFVRSESGYVQLLLAKARLAPLKPKLSIPKLELLAAVIGCRLYQQVVRVLNKAVRSYFWTDSTVVMSWINSKNLTDVFVKNRIKEIHGTGKENWAHIPGEYNTSADLLSRGTDLRTLKLCRWNEGPDWLKEEPQHWPVSHNFHQERELQSNTLVHTVPIDYTALDLLISRKSSYLSIVRTVAYVLRWHSKIIKQTEVNNEVTCEEINNSEKTIWKYVQQKCLVNKDKCLKNIIFYTDNEGVLRIQSKIILSEEYPECFSRPIVLPNKHELVDKLIEYVHNTSGHVGVQTTLCQIREKFWIIRGRRAVQRVISKCVTCLKLKAKPVKVVAAPLPTERIETVACFSVTGVDALGPLYLKNTSKVWVLVFTCATYRAVHFELVTSMSTECFLLALRRFIARRGRVSTFYSDNGTNFLGLRNLLNKINWSEVQQKTCNRISWKLIPPSSPWWGGWWERMVRILKELLRKILGKSSLNFEELSTIICDCERFINDRPLTYVSENTDDLIPLTPAHFLNDIKTDAVPDLDHLDALSFSKRTRYVHKLREELKCRFKKEYVSNLVRYRNLDRKGHRELKIGEVVLIGSDGTKRQTWQVGIILKLFPGKDKNVRVALVKTSQGEYVRPLQRLHPLEIFKSN